VGFLLCALPATASQVVARHGLSGAEYQEAFKDLKNKGYRLTSISGYSTNKGARYAALWTKTSGPAWAARHGMSSGQYQKVYREMSRKGYRLSFVNGFAVGKTVYYSGIWEKKKGATTARHGMTGKQYQQVFKALSRRGYKVTHISAYSVQGSPRFAAIWEKTRTSTAARHGLSAEAYQEAFDDYAKKGYRLHVVSGYKSGKSDRYAAIWTKSGAQQRAVHGVPAKFHQHVLENHLTQSWQPTYIEAFNSADGIRFNGAFKNTTFKASELASIEAKVRTFMKSNGVPGLSFAISRNNRLVFAAGYGVADKQTEEPVGPSHRFRIASVSKTITVLALRRLLDDTALTKNSKVFGPGTVLGGSYARVPKNRTKAVVGTIEGITIDDLERHVSGLRNVDKNGDKKDPMFNYSGDDHPGLIKWTLSNYPLGPKIYDYSNFGYCLLGRVIESMTGESYESYVIDTILKPAGAHSMVLGGHKLPDRKSNEVRYYGDSAYSSVKPQRFDSHGGWIATPIDLLRVMKSQTKLGPGYGHFGGMSGTRAYLARLNAQFTVAIVTNKNSKKGDGIDTLMSEIVTLVSEWPDKDMF